MTPLYLHTYLEGPQAQVVNPPIEPSAHACKPALEFLKPRTPERLIFQIPKPIKIVSRKYGLD